MILPLNSKEIRIWVQNRSHSALRSGARALSCRICTFRGRVFFIGGVHLSRWSLCQFNRWSTSRRDTVRRWYISWRLESLAFEEFFLYSIAEDHHPFDYPITKSFFFFCFHQLFVFLFQNQGCWKLLNIILYLRKVTYFHEFLISSEGSGFGIERINSKIPLTFRHLFLADAFSLSVVLCR